MNLRVDILPDLFSTTKRCIVFILLISGNFIPLYSNAQGENNIWAFGNNLGLDFSSGSPVVISTSLYSHESSGSVCSPTGALLFYVGVPSLAYVPNQIWDKTHSVMPNGMNILGNLGTSAVNGVNILPFVNDTNLYYVFILTADEERQRGEQTYLRYSIVDMRLNGGLGDVNVARKNIIVDSFTSEQMRVTKGMNCNFWLIVTHNDTMIFDAFEINEDGIKSKPTVSGFPSLKSLSHTISDFDISPDGSQIAYCEIGANSKILLYDFNKTNGIVSNPRVLDTVLPGINRVKFSPDGSKLYVSSSASVVQYDFSKYPVLTDISSSKTTIWNSYLNAFRIGPDKKMYALTSGSVPPSTLSQRVVCIAKPEAAGPACNISQVIDLTKIQRCFGFGQPIYKLSPAKNTAASKELTVCNASQTTLSGRKGFNIYSWNDGSTDSSLTVDREGTYWIRMQNECEVHTDTFKVSFIFIPGKLKPLDTICNNSLIVLDATTPNASYLWQDGSNAATYTANKGGTYTVRIGVGPCSSLQSTSITNSNLSISLGKDQFVCNGDSILLQVPDEYNNYFWNNSKGANTLVVGHSGEYYLTVEKGICIASDTILIDFVGCSNCISLPNSFTPNGDDKNDLFRPILNCKVQEFSFTIFNRYGQNVFSTDNVNSTWDGTFNGQALDMGVYFYLIKVRFDYPNNVDELYKGDVTLIR